MPHGFQWLGDAYIETEVGETHGLLTGGVISSCLSKLRSASQPAHLGPLPNHQPYFNSQPLDAPGHPSPHPPPPWCHVMCGVPDPTTRFFFFLGPWLMLLWQGSHSR